MKKNIVAGFFVAMVIALALLVNTGIVGAAQEGYEFNHYVALTEPTVDGEWTPVDEWTDVDMAHQMDGDLNVTFRTNWMQASSQGYTGYPVFWIIEFYDDNTTDAEDYVSLCLDGNGDGGTAPQADDFRVDFVGHDQSGLTMYRGDGSAWVETTELTWGESIEIVDSISASPNASTPHYIIEMVFDHIHIPSGPDQCVRLVVYDESNSGAGEQAWPDSSVDVPDEWGQTWSLMESVPEGFTFAVMVFVSSVSLLVGSQYLKKRSKKREN